MSTILSLILSSSANVLDAAFYALYILLIARLVMNFYVAGPGHPAVDFVYRATELVLLPIRQKLRLEPRVVDGSILLVFFSMIFIQGIVVGLLRNFSQWLAK
ncbi:YggT family protein [bacterium]|nr:YggT family protein [bacterium]